MFFAHVWLRSVLSWLFEHHKPHRIWYFSLLIRVAFICASYISCIQNTWPFHRSPECFATSLVAEMLTCVGKSDLSLHEILVSVKPFVSEWNRSRLQLLIHTQLYMGEARKFKLTLFILFNLNQLTNETVNAGFACNALLLCQLRNVFKNKGEKTRPEQQCEGSLHIYSVCLGDVSLKPFSVFELFFSCLVKVDLWFFVWKMNWLWKSEPIQVLLKKRAHSRCWYWCF